MPRLPSAEREILSAEPGDAQPFLKWAGGKWAMAPRIAALLPCDADKRVYREPFLGGAAMFFYLRPARAFLTDAVPALISTYTVVQRRVEPLIKELERLRAAHSSEQYYEVRERFNAETRAAAVKRAAWLIYLNKTCFNGLFRTNKRGLFNVPQGRFDNPRILHESRLRAASVVLGRADLACLPFEHLLDVAEKGDLIYLDPPYVPLSRTSSFDSYADGGFGAEQQERLASVFQVLDARGCLLALSNSDTPRVRELYRGYDLSPIVALRAISAKASTRGPTSELLVRNVRRYPKR